MVMYDNEFFAERLASLRTKKGVSARDMSLTIGQSPNYVNKIEGKKAYPSMEMFFVICEYLGISPKDFFDVGAENPVQINELLEEVKVLDDKAVAHILGLVRSLRTQKG